jgi:hypothetical protein
MKVSELIEELKKCNPELDVRVDFFEKCRLFTINGLINANIYNEDTNKRVPFVQLLINKKTKVIRYIRMPE